MRILIITRNAWDDTNAIGNTMSNFFGEIEDIEFANIYFRSSRPNNKLCKNYYQTSETEVLKKWFSPEKIGKRFVFDANAPRATSAGKKEKTLIRFIQKYGVKLAYKISDRLWYSKKWINDNLKDFIESYSPDMMFAFVRSAPQYYLTIQYLRENYNIPLFCWIADDEYTGLLQNNSTREIENLKYILNESSVVKGCSEEICEYYNSIFDCKATPIYKGCDLSTPIKQTVGDPIKIVYAGNLLYGRLDIISKIADAIEGRNVCFEVYSNTALLSSEIQQYFGQKQCTKYMGKREYGVIKEQLSAADIVVHVESFEDSEILKTRYSFSTKIIDYLQSGSVVLGIGPKEVSSIKYINKIPGAYVIESLDDLQTKLYDLLGDASNFIDRAGKTREFARQYHDSAIISKQLTQTINQIIKEEA